MATLAKKVVGDDLVAFKFTDGEKLICKLSGLPDEIITRLALHGIAQKVGDSYSGVSSIQEARANAAEVWENLKRGIWATKAVGGKLAEAFARATGQPLDDCLEKLSGMTEEEKKDLRKHPQIKAAMAAINAERAAKLAEGMEGVTGTDLGDLFK
jgi:hypothetical protein